MASKESPECAAMRECHVGLVETLSLSINSLGDALFAKGLIPSDVRVKIQSSSSTITPTDKAREILNSLSILIKHDPKKYQKFVEVLKDEGQWAESIVEKLTSCYQSLTGEKISLKNESIGNEEFLFKLTFPKGSSEELIKNTQLCVNYMDQNSSEKTIYKPATFSNDVQSNELAKGSYGFTCNERRSNGVIDNRDVLFLVSNDIKNVKRRPKHTLTQEEYKKLDGQGIHPDNCHSDLSIMTIRYGFDKLCSIQRMEYKMNSKEVIHRIENLMRNTDKSGVVLYYVGPGKRGTGDWCFSDGYVTFMDVMELYCSYLKGRVLTIVSDCSFSGNWVKMAMDFLDKQEIGPCGHTAKEKKILIKVLASCKANEIPVERTFAIHCATNDKNSGQVLWNLTTTQIGDNQHANGIDFTQIRCKNNIDQPCTMRPGSTWEIWNYNVVLLNNTDKGRPAWHYAMINDDESIRVLAHGWGQNPPIDKKKQITDRYFVDYNYPNLSKNDDDFEMSL